MQAKLHGTIDKVERHENPRGLITLHVSATGKVDSALSTARDIRMSVVMDLKSAIANEIKLGASVEFTITTDNATSPVD